MTRMFPSIGIVAHASVLALACHDPTAPVDLSRREQAADAAASAPEPPENCGASSEWLPRTPPLPLFEPLPHPNAECPFYRGGWQAFLIATEPDSAGEPALRSYPTLDDVFVSKKAHAPRNTAQRAWLGDIKQAGGRQILIDQSGHTIYYGIHVNQLFADFVAKNGLQTLEGVQRADPSLFLPAGVVEFKSAWLDIDPADGVAPGRYANYITTNAWVPTLHQDANSHLITEDKDHPRLVQVALLALHVVYAMPGHPELVWTSFQHVDENGLPDTAPAAAFNPDQADPYNLKKTDVVCPSSGYVLCKPGTTAQTGNQAFNETDLVLDEAAQKFRQSTSIYRMFPGSKSDGVDNDAALVALNANMAALFKKSAPNDKRRFYQLVGGQWLDKPAAFALDVSLQNDNSSPLIRNPDQEGFAENDARKALLASGVRPLDDLRANGSDSPFSILAGEDRLSSTAMESFTQSPASFYNCFQCHNTQAINAHGTPVVRDPTQRKLLDPKLINVSHVFSQFVLQETE